MKVSLKFWLRVRVISFIALLFVISALCITASGADTTSVFSPSIPTSWEKWLLIAYSIYEIIVLLKKSDSNLSVIGNILRWLTKGGNRKN